jgi:acyl-CoA synthetase (AMP-forming)/AMP-acid ligase II
MLRSQLCSAESLRSPALRAWAERLRPMWAAGDDAREVMLHRKMWEWLFIAEALRERGMLAPGRRGVGFGVGQEPLVALFADAGCDVVATDQPHESAVASGWTDSEVEWSGGLEGLNGFGLCDAATFAQWVAFRPVDMNALPADLTGFDFAWSSCALEHLGTLEAGLDFVVAQMACLRPGGVAVHTTEYLVSSNDATVEAGGTVFYRRRDIEGLVARLRRAGHDVDIDYSLGSTPDDVHVDVPPYTDVHLRTELAGYVTTSLALIVTKGDGAGRRRRLLRRRGDAVSR